MKAYRSLLLLLIPVSLFFSCSKDLNINDDWKEIMVVYGLLNPNDSVHYVKITKAFLGPGNALQYATIPDSSNFGGKIRVRLDEYDGTTLIGSTFLDTTMITNKDTGIFYFPDQLIYYTQASDQQGPPVPHLGDGYSDRCGGNLRHEHCQ